MDFIIDTLFQIFFAFFWVIGLLIFWIKRDKENKSNRKVYILLVIFIPLLMVWSTYAYINILHPRFLDINNFINKDYRIIKGECSEVRDSARGITSSFILKEETYYYNPKGNEVYEGENYKIKYLPNSKYVIDIETL